MERKEAGSANQAVEEPLVKADDEVVGDIQDLQQGESGEQGRIHVHQVVSEDNTI